MRSLPLGLIEIGVEIGRPAVVTATTGENEPGESVPPSPLPTLVSRAGRILRIAAPIAILGWLVSAVDADQFDGLRERSVYWPVALIASSGILLAVCLTFVRWYFLVRALELPFRLRDAFRLGFTGFFCSFISVGAVGGDVFKAFFIAREHPGRRTLAVASVLVDRLMGVFALVLVTATAMACGGIPNPTPELLAVRTTTYAAASIGTAGILVVLTPGFTTGPLAEWIGSIPWIGPVLDRIIQAIRFYRRRIPMLIGLGFLSLSIHLIIAASIHAMSSALYATHPTLVEHFVIVNLSSIVGALPFTPAGLGTFELAMTTLYEVVPRDPGGSGIIVALAYRLATIAIAGLGVLAFTSGRRDGTPVRPAAVSEAAE